ncbi:MAG: tetratricopeptide repeat protein [Alphaproteobacteria bacterium]
MYTMKTAKTKAEAPTPAPAAPLEGLDATTAAFMREVDDALHEEKLANLWKNSKYPLIAALIALFVGVAGWQFWGTRAEKLAQNSADAWFQVLDDENKPENRQLLAALGEKSATGVQVLALLKQGRDLATAGKAAEAQAAFEQAVGVDAPKEFQQLAALHAAMALLNTDATAAEAALVKLDNPANPYRATTLELLAELHETKGDKATALSFWEKLGGLPNTPPTLLERAAARAADLRAGAGL